MKKIVLDIQSSYEGAKCATICAAAPVGNPTGALLSAVDVGVAVLGAKGGGIII